MLTGGAFVALLAGVGLAGTASYGYAADDPKDAKTETEEQTVIVEVIREDGLVSIDRIVKEINGIHDGDGLHLVEELSGDESARIIRIHRDGDGASSMTAHCMSEGGEEAVMFEFKDEEGDDNERVISHNIICLTGDDAKPENRAEALRKVIAQMEQQGRTEKKRRDAMIKKMRKELKELEKDR